MFTSKELWENFGKIEGENTSSKKYKWYILKNADYNFIFNNNIIIQVVRDKFWTNIEKEIILRILEGESVTNWQIEYRTFQKLQCACIIHTKPLVS